MGRGSVRDARRNFCTLLVGGRAGEGIVVFRSDEEGARLGPLCAGGRWVPRCGGAGVCTGGGVVGVGGFGACVGAGGGSGGWGGVLASTRRKPSSGGVVTSAALMPSALK